MLKRLLAAIVLTLAASSAHAGCLLLLGAGVCNVSASINTPSITPQPSALFTQSNASLGNVGLVPVKGAFTLQSDPQKSFFVNTELLMNPASTGGSASYSFLLGSSTANVNYGVSAATTSNNALSIVFNTGIGGGPISGYWWLPTGASDYQISNFSYTKATNAALGFYNFTATTGCPSSNGSGAREPNALLSQSFGGGAAADPGFLCSADSPSGAGPTASLATVPGLGYNQAATISACSSNTPVAGAFQITMSVVTPHGLEQGTGFALNGFTPAGFNTNYVITGTSASDATHLVGNSFSTGTCPTASFPLTGGTIGAGSAGTVSFSAPNAVPFIRNSTTGIQLAPNQRACFAFGENGDDTNFPGSQWAYGTKFDGTPLQGSSTPVLSPWLNMGAVAFQGYTSATTQAAGLPSLTVTAMDSYAVSAATKATGQLYDVQFTFAANPFIIGSEFTVSGVTNSGTGSFNGTYVAVAPTGVATTGTTVYGKLLSGPAGLPATFSGSPTFMGAGSVVGVIMPGMQVLGTNGYALIMPYHGWGSTGIGGTGTYGLTNNQAAVANANSSISGNTLTVVSSPALSRILVPGILVTASGYSGHIDGFGTGTGAAGTYHLDTSGTVAGPTGISFGPFGDSSVPTSVEMYAAQGFYSTLAANTAGPPWGKVSQKLNTTIGDIFTLIGSNNPTTTGATKNGWNGAMGNLGLYAGIFPNTNGLPSTASFDSICQKTVDYNDFAIANSGSWKSLYRLNRGDFADSSIAQFTASITGATGATATLNVSSTQTGALTGSGTATLAGDGIPGCPTACPTFPLGAGPTYTLTWGSAIAANVSSEAMTAGNLKPAAPLQSIPLTGSLSTSGGNGVLTVTSVAPSVSPWTGTAVSISSTGLVLNYTSATAPPAGQCVVDSAGVISPTAPFCFSGTPTTSAGTVQKNYFPVNYTFPGSDTLYAFQTRIVTGQWVMGPNITTPAMVTGQLTTAACSSGPPIPAGVKGECGTYSLSTAANGTVRSGGLFMSGVGAAGAISPGLALTIDNPGLGIIYPITPLSSPLVGTMAIKGTYNAGLLGGTPTSIQAQVSQTPGGPPVAGCSGCAWQTILLGPTGGTWAGTVSNIIPGGPYYVSVRAGNGVNYTTMPNPVGVGTNYAPFGQGNNGWLYNNDASQVFTWGNNSEVAYPPGAATGATPVFGPPVVGNITPNYPGQVALDSYGANAFLGEGTSAIMQNTSDMLGGPTGMANFTNNGINSLFIAAEDNILQTQTIGIGDGSSTVFSSGAGFGGTVGGAGSNSSVVNSQTTTLTTGGITTAGLMNTLLPTGNWNSLAPGDALSCATCMGGGAYSGVIVAAAPTVPAGSSTQLTGLGGAGTYQVSPAPSPAIASGQVLTITHNLLVFNSALPFGAGVLATYNSADQSLTINSFTSGNLGLAPSMVVSDGTNTATMVGCIATCNQSNPVSSKWKLSAALSNPGVSMAMAINPATGAAPWGGAPSIATSPLVSQFAVGGNGGGNIVKYGTFKVLVDGVVVCSDAGTIFSWQLNGASCTDAGASVVNTAKSWVNYVYGTYSITFNSAVGLNKNITAQWVDCSTLNADFTFNNVCWMGNGQNTDGIYSSVAARTGGINGWLNAQQVIPAPAAEPDGVVNNAKVYNDTFANNMARLHNGHVGMPLLTAGMSRWEGAVMLYKFGNAQGQNTELYMDDAVTKSQFSGTVGTTGGSSGQWTAILTLTSNVTGSIWDGEFIDCNPDSNSCSSTALAAGQGLPPLTEIVGLCTVSLCGTVSPAGLGQNGSTYLLTSTVTNPTGFNAVNPPIAMDNALYYQPGNGAYVGPAYDVGDQTGATGIGNDVPEQFAGPFSSIRVGQRNGIAAAAAIAGDLTKGSAPTISRTKAAGCTPSSSTSPCGDTGSTYAAAGTSASWTNGQNTITIPGGIAAGTRPFVAGHLITCLPSCGSNLIVTNISLPPDVSSATGQGQAGQFLTLTLSGNVNSTASGTGTVTGGCTGTSSTPSCVDITWNIVTGGTYAGQSARIETCGVNNLMGTNANSGTTPPFGVNSSSGFYKVPNGTCVPTGVGSLVMGFRIGSAALTDSLAAINVPATFPATGIYSSVGSAYFDGADYGFHAGVIQQNSAFTCNIVDAVTVQCVKGPQFNLPGWSAALYGTTAMDGLYSGPGVWPIDTTYVSYGDNVSTGLTAGLQGNAGGQPLALTPGSGYTVPTTSAASSTSGFTTVGGLCPYNVQTVAMGISISGGKISNAYPTSIGQGTIGTCAFVPGYQVFGTVSGVSNPVGGPHTATLTIGVATVTSAGGAIGIGTGQTITFSSATNITNLTLGSKLNNVAAQFPLLITACPGTGCGTTGNYLVTNLNTANLTAVTSWTTAVTNNSGAPPAQTGPLSAGAIISDGVQPNGSYIALTTANAGYNGTYQVTCPTTCVAKANATFNVGLQSGSGGAIATPPLSPFEGISGITTYDMSSNKTGLYISDNSGAVSGNPLWGKFNTNWSNGTTTTQTAPGMAAKPFGQHRGLRISDASASPAVRA
jgi:hypothetical protein